MSDDFWSRAVLPAPPVTEYADAGQQYRAMNYGTSLPEDWVAAHNGQGQQPQNRPEYAEGYTGLEGYTSRGTQSKHLPKPGEKCYAYKVRVETQVRWDALPQVERDVVMAAYQTALERLAANPGDNDPLLADTATADGTGIGIYGKDVVKEHQSRAAATAASYRDNAHLGYQSVAPGVPSVNLAGVRQDAEQARAQATAARYSHVPLARPSGDGLIVSTS